MINNYNFENFLITEEVRERNEKLFFDIELLLDFYENLDAVSFSRFMEMNLTKEEWKIIILL